MGTDLRCRSSVGSVEWLNDGAKEELAGVVVRRMIRRAEDEMGKEKRNGDVSAGVQQLVGGTNQLTGALYLDELGGGQGWFLGRIAVDARIDQDGIGHEKKSTRNAAGKTEKKAPQKVRWSPEKKRLRGRRD